MKCKVHGEKPITDFFVHIENSRTRYRCKACHRERTKRYYEANKEKISLANRQYKQKNKERYKIIDREYREKNKEKIAEFKRLWYLAKKDSLMTEEKKARIFRFQYNREMFSKGIVSMLCEKHNLLSGDDIYIHPTANKYVCKPCQKHRAQVWLKHNREHQTKVGRAWRNANRQHVRALERIRYYKDIDKARERRRKYRENNLEYMLEQRRRLIKKLPLWYVKTVIVKRSGLKTKDIPDALAEAKKIEMLLKRKLKEINSGHN